MGLYRDNGKGNGGYYLGFRGLGFPKILCTFLGGPIIRTIIFLGSILGPPYFGKLPYQGLGFRVEGLGFTVFVYSKSLALRVQVANQKKVHPQPP